jgi:hypothetical protein
MSWQKKESIATRPHEKKNAVTLPSKKTQHALSPSKPSTRGRLGHFFGRIVFLFFHFVGCLSLPFAGQQW